MAIWLSVIGIIVAIVIGWKFKFNTGVIAMVFAFLIGTLCQFPQVNKAGEHIIGPMTVNTIVGLFPTTIVFYLIAIALFFGYATENGTMDILGRKLLYALGGNAKLVPFVIAGVCALVGGLGAGASTPVIVGPFAFTMCITAGVSPVMCAVAIGFGNLIGSNNPFNGYGGVIGLNLIRDNGVDDATAFQMATYTWVNTIIIAVVMIILYYFFTKSFKGQHVKMEKPPAFNSIQTKTLWLVILAFVFMVVPALLNVWVKGNHFIATLARVCQPQTIMVIGAVICAFMKLGNERKVIAKCPWNTIVMIIGVYMLIQVANKGGLAAAIANALSNSIPAMFVPVAIVAFAAFLSFFSSSTSTVMPLMYPLVPGLVENLGLNPVTLYTCIFWGGLSTALSPFSTGGAITIASCPDEEVKDALPNKMIVVAVVVPIITMVLVFLGIFNIFSV
ncbi:MAG: SLC13 family permease [Coriobacteriales bacterium]|nr:SLC13 family permease [Coriobacteriales bacterium]